MTSRHLKNTTPALPGLSIPQGLVLSACIFFLSSCAAPPTTKQVPLPVDSSTIEDPLPELIEEEITQLTTEEYIEQLLQAAENRREPTTIREAVLALLDLESIPAVDLQRANQLWEWLVTHYALSHDDRLLGAKLAMYSGDNEKALLRLHPLSSDHYVPDLVPNLELAASLQTHLMQWHEAIETRILLDRFFTELPDKDLDNQALDNFVQLWKLLAAVEGTPRLPHPVPHIDQEVEVWFDLFQVFRHTPPELSQKQAILQAWKDRHPEHRTSTWADTLLQPFTEFHTKNLRIAVLLPLSGPLQDLGEAILEGVLAQYYQQSANRVSEILILDTAGNPELALKAFYQAISSEVDRIIGPLTRAEVDRISEVEIPLPVLFLNRPTAAVSQNASVLALSPEQDSRAAARRAIALGDRNAILIAPRDDFGDRISSSFRDHFESLGGKLLGDYRLDPSTEDINDQVGSILGIDDSRERILEVRRLLRMRLNADPQMDSAIETILIAGPARQVRMLIPHLHYHHASRLRILSTSHVFEGNPEPARDIDLIGLQFPDAPLLHVDFSQPPWEWIETIPSISSSLPRFAALGYDSLLVTSMLSEFTAAPHLRLRGIAGTWTLQPFSRIWYREPVWLEFRDGVPAVISHYANPGT